MRNIKGQVKTAMQADLTAKRRLEEMTLTAAERLEQSNRTLRVKKKTLIWLRWGLAPSIKQGP